MYVRLELKEMDALKKRLNKLKDAPDSVLESLKDEAKERVPKWIAAEVSNVYNVKKSAVNDKSLGSSKVVDDGGTLGLKFIYAGRVLTPTHFALTPKALKAPNGTAAYTLKATIIRGQRKTLGSPKKMTKKQRRELGKNFTRQGPHTSNKSPIMLMYTGNKREGGVNYIPFQRVSNDRSDLKAIKTVSLPQMVSSERTYKNIKRTITENLQERLDHYVKYYTEGATK